MKRAFAALLYLVSFAAPLTAKPWTVGQQSISYAPSGTPGTILAPNTAPAYAYQAADIPSNFDTSIWIHTGTGGQFDNGSGNEDKGRFDCEPVVVAHDDPLLAFNVVNGSSHDHEASGNYAAFTTGHFHNLDYAALRSAGNSTCYGGPINRSLYWAPAVKQTLSNGVIATKKASTLVTYYVGGGTLSNRGDGTIWDMDKTSLWPRGLSFIGGFNPSDPGNSRRAALVAAAGAGYAIADSDPALSPGVSWYCGQPVSGDGSVATSPVAGSHQPWLRNGDGTPTLNCSTADKIVDDTNGPKCWDGVNLDSPDERSHVANLVRDGNIVGSAGLKCPQGWASIPMLETKREFTHNGQSDYTNWWVDSDRMPGMNFATATVSGSGTTLTTSAATSSLSASKWHAITGTGIPALTMITAVSGSAPNFTLTLNHAVTGTLTAVAATIPFNNGETDHFDFTPAWDVGTACAPGVFLLMMQHTVGLTITQGSTGGCAATLTGDPHEAGSGMFMLNKGLWHAGEASPDGSAPNPILTLEPNRTGKNGYYPAPAHTPIPGSVHNSH